MAGLVVLGGCQMLPAETAAVEGLPGCFVDGTPWVRPGMGKVRLRWVYRSDSAFRPRSVDISIDGQSIHASDDSKALQQEVLVLADLEVSPGRHRLDSTVRVSGWGVGVFAYLQGYRFERQSRHVFDVEAGSAQCVTLVVYYKDGVTLPLGERPATLYVQEPP